MLERFVQFDDLAALDLRHRQLETLRDFPLQQMPGVLQHFPAFLGWQRFDLVKDFSDTHDSRHYSGFTSSDNVGMDREAPG